MARSEYDRYGRQALGEPLQYATALSCAGYSRDRGVPIDIVAVPYGVASRDIERPQQCGELVTYGEHRFKERPLWVDLIC